MSGEEIEGVESYLCLEERLFGKMVGKDGGKVVRARWSPYFVELSSDKDEKCEKESVEISVHRDK